MPYIPKEHEKYNLLPFSRKNGGEVFSYPSDLVFELSSLLPEKCNVFPYGYKSYGDYYQHIDEYRARYAQNNQYLDSLLLKLKYEIKRMNIKENWTIARYIGQTHDIFPDFTHGQCYYFPCSIENPVYEGIIDNEEFTSCYTDSLEESDWIVLEDPLHITLAFW